MQRREYFNRIRGELSGCYPPEEARAMTLILFQHCLKLEQSHIFLSPDAALEADSSLEEAVRQLKTYRPLQYVLGAAEFDGLIFSVDEHVLIPRPETEELVRWISEEWKGKSPAVLDIGTGSGAIAVSLAKRLPGSTVTAVDLSEEALNIARENAERNEAEVDFKWCDILNDQPAGRFDVIVSNPPYVRELEKAAMRKNVLDYEPATALFVPDDDPLLFYRRITRLASGSLNSGGALYFEINEAFGQETAALLTESGFHGVELRKDLSERDRMLRGIWN